MPLRLDTRAPEFRRRTSPRFSTGSARPTADVDAAVAAILADVRQRGDARAHRLDPALRPARADADDHAHPAAEIVAAARRLRGGDARRAPASRQPASRPITAASCRRISDYRRCRAA